MMNWRIKANNPELICQLEKELNLHPLICQLLINRNILNRQQALNFLEADFSFLTKPQDLFGVTQAAERIQKAKLQDEKVFIFGDYDADGISACALLKACLERIGIEPIVHLPHRLEEGYGVNIAAVNQAKKQGVKLFISVDCGITSFAEMEKLREFNIEAIIIDHHEPKLDKLPRAKFIINPKANIQLEYIDLTAVGLVFKLAQAILDSSLEEYCDFVALGTICDVASLLGENRILVKEGLKRITDSPRLGIQALKEISGIADKQITAGLVGFVLGPRLNAMGRLQSAKSSLELLNCCDEENAKILAKDLNDTNRRRQKIEEKILQEAVIKIERDVNFKDHSVIVIEGDDWHPGVVGVIAAKLTERYFRPTFVLASHEDSYRGSGRSINNFHLFEALCECDSLLKNYGGHKRAAGLTVLKKDLKEFKVLLNNVAKNRLKQEDLIPILDIEADVPLSIWEDSRLLESIEGFAPFGAGNPKPVFCSRGIQLNCAPVCVGKNSLRLWVSDGIRTCKAIGFGLANFSSLLKEGMTLDLAYCVSLDTWDEPVVQLEIKDIRLRN
jgi:single-stranded-DNA-specific exonuclease